MNEKQFQKRLSVILADNNVSRRNEREKAGMINPKRIGRFGTTPYLFRRHDEDKLERNYWITILLDSSGSMHDGKDKVAADSVIALAKVLEKIKGIKFEIITYSASTVTVKSFEEKFDAFDFTETMSHISYTSVNYSTNKKGDLFDGIEGYIPEGYSPKVEKDYLKLERWISENYDPVAVSRAYRGMKKLKGKKIIFVLSDGEPTDGNLYSLSQYGYKTLRGTKDLQIVKDKSPERGLKEIVRTVSKDSEFLIAAIGIKTKAVAEFYPKYAVVNNLDQLFPKTIKLLSSLVKKT